MNIPIYRAKKLDSDEYVISSTIIKNKMWTDGKGYHDVFYILEDENVSILKRFPVYYPDVVEIDPTTLAIHSPDMIDSQGNKIFASLSEDGKGGDIMKDDEYYGIAKYADNRFVVEYENVEECLCEGNFEVVGIQE